MTKQNDLHNVKHEKPGHIKQDNIKQDKHKFSREINFTLRVIFIFILTVNRIHKLVHQYTHTHTHTRARARAHI